MGEKCAPREGKMDLSLCLIPTAAFGSASRGRWARSAGNVTEEAAPKGQAGKAGPAPPRIANVGLLRMGSKALLPGCSLIVRVGRVQSLPPFPGKAFRE